MEDKDFIKVRAFLRENLVLTSDGLRQPDNFNDKVYDYDEEFREPIIIDINEKLQGTNWAVKFIENSYRDFHVLAFTDTDEDFQTIKNVIRNKIVPKGFSLDFELKGSWREYTRK